MKYLYLYILTFFLLNLNTTAKEILDDKPKVFSENECLEKGIKPLSLKNGEKIMPQYDGKNYFIDYEGYYKTDTEDHPSDLLIQTIVNDAISTNRVINLTNVEDLISGDAGIDFKSFPIVLSINKPNCYIVLLSLTFTTAETKLDIGILSKSEIMNSDGKLENIYFGMRNLTIKNGGGISGRIDFIAPRSISLYSLENVGVLTLGAGSAFCLGCSGNKKTTDLIIAGTFDFNPSYAHVEKKDVNTGEIKDDFSVVAKMNYSFKVTDWSEVIISLGFPPNSSYGIQFSKFNDIGFWSKSTLNIPNTDSNNNCENIYETAGNIILDLSSTSNSSAMSAIKDYCPSDTISNSWKGFFLKDFDVRFPRTIRKNGSAKIEYLWGHIDFFYIANNEVSLKGGFINDGGGYLFNGDSFKLGDGFDIKLTDLSIQICQNKLTGFLIGGALRLPVNGLENYELGFKISKTQTGTADNSLSSLEFDAFYKKTDPLSLFGGYVTLTDFKVGAGTINIQNFKFDGIQIFIEGSVPNKNGKMTVGKANSNLGILNMEFGKLVVTNKAPFVTEFSIYPTNNNAVDLSGFSIGLQYVNVKGTTGNNPKIEGTACITVALDVPSASSQTPIKGAAKLLMEAEWKAKPNEKYEFDNFDITVKGVTASANFAMFGFSGCVDFFKNESKFGISGVSGFSGSATFWVKFQDAVAGNSPEAPASPGSTTTNNTSPTTDPTIPTGTATGNNTPINQAGTATASTNAAQVAVACDCVLKPNNGGDISGGVRLDFIKNNGESIWAASVGLKFKKALPSETAPIAINEIFGGAYKNLVLSGAADSDPLSNTYTFKRDSWGFNIGLGLKLNAYNSDLNVAIAAQIVNSKVDWIKGMAYFKFRLDPQNILPPISDKMTDNLSGINNTNNNIGEQTKTYKAGSDGSLNSNVVSANLDAAKKSISFLSNSSSSSENKVAAGAILTMNFTEGFFSLIFYPDISINLVEGIGTLKSTGRGILYLDQNYKYFYLGKSNVNDRLGLEMNITKESKLDLNACINAYFMVGNVGIGPNLPPPLIPAELLCAEFQQKVSSGIEGRVTTYSGDSYKNGEGLAFGAAIGVKAEFTAAFVFNVIAKAGAGFDALLTNASCSTVTDNGWGTSDKNWRAAAQVYGYAMAKIKIYTVDIASLGVAFLLRANVPKPLYAEGQFLVYASVWKAQVKLKVNGKFGSGECIPAQAPTPVLVQSAKLIDKVLPNTPVVSKVGNIYVYCKNPIDQLKGAPNSNGWLQMIKVTYYDGQTVVGVDSVDNLNPITTANMPTPISLAKVKLEKNKTYTAKVRTYIYTADPIFEKDSDGNPTSIGKTTENIVTYNYENTLTSLDDNANITISISDVDYLLNEDDILIYPAKNQFNTYLADFGGQGYMKIEPVLAKNIKTTCPECTFNLEFIDKAGAIVGNKIPITDISTEINYALPNLTAGATYQIKINFLKNGIEKTIYSEHYFRVAAKENLFKNIIASIKTNKIITYDGENLAFGIEVPNLIFSKEETSDLITSKINIGTDTWFKSISTAVSKCFDINWNSKMDAILQNKIYTLDNNQEIEVVTNYVGSNAKLLYSPFDPAIFNLMIKSKDLSGCENCTGCDIDGKYTIPLFEGEHCFELTYDISKLPYILNHAGVGTLPQRFAPITSTNQQDICFDAQPPIDFNDLSQFKKIIEITCNRSAVDSKNIEYVVKLKKTLTSQQPTYLSFSEDLKLNQTNPEAIYSISKGDINKQFVTAIPSSSECPTKDNFTVGSLKYDIEVIPVNEKNLDGVLYKPCVTYKDISKQSAIDYCYKTCSPDEFNDNCKICEIAFPTNVILKIEAWEDETHKDVQTFHETTTINFSNGKSVTIPKGQSSIEIDMGPGPLPADFHIVLNDSLYKCGEDLDKLPLNSLTKYTIVGEGVNATLACSNNLSPNLPIYGTSSLSSLVVNSSKFYLTNIKPADYDKVPTNFYTFERNGIREYLKIENGVFKERNSCASKPYICVTNCDMIYGNVSNNNTDYLQIKFTFYTDEFKTKTFIPYDIPDEGLKITFSNGKQITIAKNLINSTDYTFTDNSISDFTCQIIATNYPNSNVCNITEINCTNPPAPPTITASNANPTFGQTITLTADCGNNQTIWFNSEIIPSINVTVTQNSQYWAKCLNNICTSVATSQIVNLKMPSIKTSKDNICSGTPLKLTLAGCTVGQINWTSNPTLTISNPVDSVITVLPTAQTVFSVTCTANAGGQSTAVTVNKTMPYFNSPNAPTLTASDKTNLCLGESLNLVSTNCSNSSLIWNPTRNSNSNSIQITPSTNTAYSATCENLQCSSPVSNIIAVMVDSVSTPVISHNLLSAYSCEGKPILFSATGCAASEIPQWYANNSAIGTGKTITVTPATSTTYLAKCKKEIYSGKWCEGKPSNTATITILNGNNMNISLTIDTPNICEYSSTNLRVQGCVNANVQWKKDTDANWITNNSRIRAIQETVKSSDLNFSSYTYYVRCNLNDNCFNPENLSGNDINKTLNVYREPLSPTLTNILNAKNQICQGTSINLNGTCLNSSNILWQWNDGTTLTPSRTPNQSETYFAACEKNYGSISCVTQATKRSSQSLTYIPTPPKPNIFSSSNKGSSTNTFNLCAGESTNISASACNNGTLLWSIDNGAETTNPNLSNVNQSHSYKVKCKVWECESDWSDQYNLIIGNNPSTPTISSNKSNYVCDEVVSISASYCDGTLNWSNGSTGTSLTLTNAQNTNYSVKCQDRFGCESAISNVIKVDIRNKPNASISGINDVCSGVQFTLNAENCSGGSTNWSTSENSMQISPTINSTTTYTLSCNVNGCSNTASKSVTVKQTPTTPSIVLGGSYCASEGKLMGISDNTKCYGTIKWSDGAESSSRSDGYTNTRTIYNTGVYTYTAKCVANGCESNNSQPITFEIFEKPSAPSISAASTRICNGTPITLSVSNTCGDGAQYTWMQRLDNQNTLNYYAYSKDISISQAGEYKVYCNKNYGNNQWCSSPYSSSINITASSANTPSINTSLDGCNIKFSGTNCNGELRWYWVDAQRNQNYITSGNEMMNMDHSEYTAICYNDGCSSSTVSTNIDGLKSQISAIPNWQYVSYCSDCSPPIKIYEDKNKCTNLGQKYLYNYKVVTKSFSSWGIEIKGSDNNWGSHSGKSVGSNTYYYEGYEERNGYGCTVTKVKF